MNGVGEDAGDADGDGVGDGDGAGGSFNNKRVASFYKVAAGERNNNNLCRNCE